MRFTVYIERDSLGVGRTSADVRTLGAQRTTASEELCQELEAIIAARESPQTGEEQQGRGRRGPTPLH